jgi:hypothetical protein
MDARNLWRPTTRRLMRSRGMLLQPPPRPATDARLTRFTTLLDTLTDGERTLDTAHRLVEVGDPAQAERELTKYIAEAQPVLEHSPDLPGEYVDLLGQVFARCLVARAGARVEQALAGGAGPDLLLRAAETDVDLVDRLPAAWLDQKTRNALIRVQQILEPAAA